MQKGNRKKPGVTYPHPILLPVTQTTAIISPRNAAEKKPPLFSPRAKKDQNIEKITKELEEKFSLSGKPSPVQKKPTTVIHAHSEPLLAATEQTETVEETVSNSKFFAEACIEALTGTPKIAVIEQLMSKTSIVDRVDLLIPFINKHRKFPATHRLVDLVREILSQLNPSYLAQLEEAHVSKIKAFVQVAFSQIIQHAQLAFIEPFLVEASHLLDEDFIKDTFSRLQASTTNQDIILLTTLKQATEERINTKLEHLRSLLNIHPSPALFSFVEPAVYRKLKEPEKMKLNCLAGVYLLEAIKKDDVEQVNTFLTEPLVNYLSLLDWISALTYSFDTEKSFALNRLLNAMSVLEKKDGDQKNFIHETVIAFLFKTLDKKNGVELLKILIVKVKPLLKEEDGERLLKQAARHKNTAALNVLLTNLPLNPKIWEELLLNAFEQINIDNIALLLDHTPHVGEEQKLFLHLFLQEVLWQATRKNKTVLLPVLTQKATHILNKIDFEEALVIAKKNPSINPDILSLLTAATMPPTPSEPLKNNTLVIENGTPTANQGSAGSSILHGYHYAQRKGPHPRGSLNVSALLAQINGLNHSAPPTPETRRHPFPR